MKVLIVYHKVDLDGVFSAAVAKMKYESDGNECILYPWTYGDSMDGIEEKVAGDIDVLVLEICLFRTMKESYLNLICCAHLGLFGLIIMQRQLNTIEMQGYTEKEK